MTIRPATLADVPDLVRLGQAFLATSIYGSVFRENPEAIAKLATHLIEVDDGTVLVSGGGDRLDGTIGLLCAPHVWTGDVTCSECFWFVDPAARGSLGVRLFHAAEAWARAQGVTSLQMISPEGETQVEAIYQRSGYVPLETGWVKALTPEATPWAI